MPAKKLDMDFVPVSRLRDHMDKDTSDPIAALCTRIGMLMEDISLDALIIGGMSGNEREAALERIDNALEQMETLAAARALVM